MAHIIDNILSEGNLTYSSNSPAFTSTPITLNGTTTLTVSSTYMQEFTGTATGYSVVLPSTSLLTTGWRFDFINQSSQPITIKYNDGTTFSNLPASVLLSVILETKGTTNGTWVKWGAATGGTATGILNYSISSSTPFTLSTGTADTLITGMSLTPVQGTYAIWYDGSIVITGNNTVVRTTFYKANVLWTDSLRTIESSVSTFNTTHSTVAIIQFTGSELLEVRVARSSNTLTISGRSLILIRLGD